MAASMPRWQARLQQKVELQKLPTQVRNSASYPPSPSAEAAAAEAVQPLPPIARESEVTEREQSSTMNPHGVEDEAESIVTSRCSSESVRGDYGLHRALNSVVVPNGDNPIATVKDRKNATYIDAAHHSHNVKHAELQKAMTRFRMVSELHTVDHAEFKLETLLDREYLNATDSLARNAREYKAQVDNLNELREMPKLSREDLKQRFTNFKAKQKLNAEDDEEPTRRNKLRETRNRIFNLEREREVLVGRSATVDALSAHVGLLHALNQDLTQERDKLVHQRAFNRPVAEHVAYLQGLNENMRNERDRFSQIALRRNSPNDKLIDQIDFLSLRNEELTDGYDNLSLRNKTLDQHLTHLDEINTGLQRELHYTRTCYATMDERLQDAHHELSGYKAQLSHAKVMNDPATQEKKPVVRTVEDFQQYIRDSEAETQHVQRANEDYQKRHVQHQETLSNMRESQAYYRSEFEKLAGQVKPMEEARKDSVADALSDAFRAGHATDVINEDRGATYRPATL